MRPQGKAGCLGSEAVPFFFFLFFFAKTTAFPGGPEDVWMGEMNIGLVMAAR